jgi:protein O-GlcNAc transferase
MNTPHPNEEASGTPGRQEIDAGLALFAAGCYAEAAALIGGITARFPLYPFGWTMLGAANSRMGQHAAALTCMQKAVTLSPDNPDVHINLGCALHGLGFAREACACLLCALQLKPDHAEAHNELGLIYRGMGRLQDAVDSFSRALAIKPEYAVAHNNLGAALRAQGRLHEAAVSLRSALRIEPNLPDAHCNLGNVLRELGCVEEACSCYREALQLNPAYAEAHYNLGVALKGAGRADAAEASYRVALQFKPALVEAHSNLGTLLMGSGRLDEAEVCYRAALQAQPDCAELHSNLGNALCAAGRPDEAAACYSRALEINPGNIEARYNLSVVQLEQGYLHYAAANLRQVLALRPDYAEAHNNLGLALSGLGWPDEAEASCRKALELKPDFAEGYTNLGCVLKDSGRLDEALACDRQALALDPGNFKIHSNFLYLLSYLPDFCDRAILEEARKFAAAHLPPAPAADARRRAPKKRLRIGYVSPDFRNHCVSFFMLPLLSQHDRAQFEIYCYAHLPRPDAVSEQLKNHADVWRTTHLQSDAQLAATISADGIDILVDLTMHMANGRPLLFAQKPAPVQVAWLAYPGTTGIPAMDYRLTDPWLDPPGQGDDCYSEISVRLPDTFWCYDPMIAGLSPNALPMLTAGHVTFGCLNNFCKVSDDTLDRWGQVMRRVQNSRLILLSPAGHHRSRVLDRLGRCGVSGQRIEFVEFRPRADYLRTYQRIDICLDTLPYNGHTTSLDAFWMGVPVVTQAGRTVAGRGGWSQLNNLGLPELAAFDADTFTDTAAALASDPQRLSGLRQTLRARMEASPLMDAKRFARAMEAAYREMWVGSTGDASTES